MARTAIAPTSVGAAGVDPLAVAVPAELTDGNSFPWGARHRLFIVNGDAVDLDVTVQTPVTVGAGGYAVADATYTVPAGTQLLLRPFGAETRRTDGQVWVDWAGATTGVDVAVLAE